ncbi:MAG: hypothetical protein A4E37_00466 [Methanoregulaceae archaeon PtaB.Bin056]|jgi:FlaG/FlaF family flagellin (archaellin)|nr:MAG: hypothetical protein A4E37_00466 [Methanoregulaceae archaeon PtaB.Bin056]
MCYRSKFRGKTDDGEAVSSIVGEMLMLALVVIVIGLVSINAQSLLPPPREPSVTVLIEKNGPGSVTFHHKGGDAIEAGDLKVLINGTENATFLLNGVEFTDPHVLFDLGDRIEAGKPGGALSSGESIRLATSRAVLYAGVVP